MKLEIERGATSQIFHIFIQDSSVTTTVAGLTGLTNGSAGLNCHYIRGGETIQGPITLETITTLGSYQAPSNNTSIRFKEVDATKMPGVYEIHVHNSWVDNTNSRRTLIVYFKGATNMVPVIMEIELTGFNHDSATVTLAQVFPTNFALLSIDGAGKVISSSVSGSVGSIAGITFPINFPLLSINTSGQVISFNVVQPIVSISGITFPSNFEILSINGSGQVSIVPSTTASNTVVISQQIVDFNNG